MFKVGDTVMFKPEREIEKLYIEYQEKTQGFICFTEGVELENKQLYGKILEITKIDDLSICKNIPETTVVLLKHNSQKNIKDHRGFDAPMTAYLFELVKLNIKK